VQPVYGYYMVPWADARVAVGATVEDAGFAADVTAGGVHDVLRGGHSGSCPVSRVRRCARCGVGLRPASIDDAPILGALPGVDGVFVATGHGANGLLLGPVSGALVADVVCGNAPCARPHPVLGRPLSPSTADCARSGGRERPALRWRGLTSRCASVRSPGVETSDHADDTSGGASGVHELRAAERCARRGDRSGHLDHVEQAAEVFERPRRRADTTWHRMRRTTLDTAEIVLPPSETKPTETNCAQSLGPGPTTSRSLPYQRSSSAPDRR